MIKNNKQPLNLFSYCATALALFVFAFAYGCAPAPETELQRPDRDAVVFQSDERPVRVDTLLTYFQETKSFTDFLAVITASNPDADPMLANADLGDATSFLRDLAFELETERQAAAKAIEAGLDQSEEFDQYVEDALREELYQKVIVEDALQDLRIKEEELRRFYEENKTSIYLEEGTNVYKVKGIYVFANQQGRPRELAQRKIQQAYQALQEGDSFESTARRYSEAPANLRGQTNALPPGAAAPAIENQLKLLSEGEYSPVFEYNDRYYIMQLIEYVEPKEIPYASVRGLIKNSIYHERRNETVFRLSQKYRDKHNCLINDELAIDPSGVSDDTVILTVPGVYELTLGEFNELAVENRKWTVSQKQDFLIVLANKAACLAEAYERGWGEDDVAPSLQVWKNKKLTELYYLGQAKAMAPSDDEINKIYEAYQGRPELSTSPVYDLYHMFFSVPFEHTMSSFERVVLFEQAKQRAQSARSLVAEGQPFTDVAKLMASDDSSAASGGRMGLIPLGDMNARLHTMVTPLESGEISQPELISDDTNNRFGYELYYVKSIRPPQPLSYDDAVERIGTSIANKHFQDLYKGALDSLKEADPWNAQKNVVESIVAYLSDLTNHPDLQVDVVYYAQTQETPEPETQSGH